MASGTSFTIASPPDSHIMKDTTSKCTPPPSTQTLKTNQCPRSTYRSEAHKQLSNQAAQEAHTEKGTANKEHLSELTRTVASLCLLKPWRRPQRSSLEPLYLEETTLPLAHNTRTHSISETHSTSPLDEHQEVPAAQVGQEDQEGQVTLLEDQMAQERYPLLISFPSNLQETSNPQGYPHYCSTATEPVWTPSSENFRYT